MSKLESTLQNSTIRTVMDIAACFGAWEPDVRVLGNVRAAAGRDALLITLNHSESQAARIAELEERIAQATTLAEATYAPDMAGEVINDIAACLRGEAAR